MAFDYSRFVDPPEGTDMAGAVVHFRQLGAPPHLAHELAHWFMGTFRGDMLIGNGVDPRIEPIMRAVYPERYKP